MGHDAGGRSRSISDETGDAVVRPQEAGPLAQRMRVQQAREGLFAELQPVKLANCELARFGEPNDGGYLACRNLLTPCPGRLFVRDLGL
jgi:hypothetical protein